MNSSKFKNIYIGIDPSLSGFGISIIDKNKNQIILDEFKADNHHNFILMCWSISNMYNDIFKKYEDYINEDTNIAQELPISSGINSGKLNALGMYFYNELGKYSKYANIYCYHPIKLKVFHHKRKYDKKDTMLVIEDILNIFKKYNYDIDIRFSRTKKNLNITNNEADSCMYAIKIFIDNNQNDTITKEILTKYPRFDKIVSLNEELGL